MDCPRFKAHHGQNPKVQGQGPGRHTWNKPPLRLQKAPPDIRRSRHRRVLGESFQCHVRSRLTLQTDLYSRSALWLEESSKVGTWISEDETNLKGDVDEKKLETGKRVQVTANKTYIKLGSWEQFML
jgi:hypothetical protein